MGRLRPGYRATAWVSPSIQCRSSKTTISGWTWLSRSSTRLTASSVGWRRWAGSSRAPATPRRPARRGAPEKAGTTGPSAEASVRSFPVTFAPDLARRRRGLDPEVVAQQVDDRQVGGRLAVGDRGGLEHDEPPCNDGNGVSSQQRRDFPTPGSPTTATTWPWPAPARSQRVAELLQLRRPTDEAREPAPCRGLEAGARGASADQLEHLDRLAEPLDRHRPERGDLRRSPRPAATSRR